MKRALPLAIGLGVSALALAALGAGCGGSSGKTIAVVEHATTDATTDTGAKGDSAGDILTFANEVFDSANTSKAGTDNGFCIRSVQGKAYECWWTTFLEKGQITVEGPFYDSGPSTLAITGGTGDYEDAHGTMDLRSRNPQGTELDFVFHLS